MVLLNLDQMIKVQDLGYHTVHKTYIHPERRLPWDVFLFVSNGQMEVWEENTEYVIKKGQFLYLKSGLHHWGEPKTPAETSWYWIHFFSVPPVEGSQELNGVINSYPTYSISIDEYHKYIRLPKHGDIMNYKKLESKLNLMIESFQSNDSLRAISLSLQTMELFLSIYNDCVSKHLLTKSDYTVQRILGYLEHKDSFCLDSKELEAKLDMNYSYLCDVFKTKTGSTIHMYNSQLFIRKAIGIMKKSNLNISEISDSLGFTNPYYFSRIFKKVTGCTPSEYRSRIYRNDIN